MRQMHKIILLYMQLRTLTFELMETSSLVNASLEFQLIIYALNTKQIIKIIFLDKITKNNSNTYMYEKYNLQMYAHLPL